MPEGRGVLLHNLLYPPSTLSRLATTIKSAHHMETKNKVITFEKKSHALHKIDIMSVFMPKGRAL